MLNPINKKARSVPVLNPVDRHGRVFFFSWLAFMLAFWAWYTFPPLVRPGEPLGPAGLDTTWALPLLTLSSFSPGAA